MSNFPETWKVATLEKDGSITVEWEIRQPYLSKGILVFQPTDSTYSELFEELKGEPGCRKPLDGLSMDELARTFREEEESPEYKEFLRQNAAIIEEMERQYPQLKRKASEEST
jgi:hypothetical protein